MSIISLPLVSTLSNGNTADAGQVTADLLQIASSVNSNAAANGVNGDITSLTALTSIAAGLTITGASLTNSTITNGTIIGGTISTTTLGTTLPVGTNTTQLATMAAIVAATFSTVLPAQPGTAAIYNLISRSGTASWALPVYPYQYITANGL